MSITRRTQCLAPTCWPVRAVDSVDTSSRVHSRRLALPEESAPDDRVAAGTREGAERSGGERRARELPALPDRRASRALLVDRSPKLAEDHIRGAARCACAYCLVISDSYY